MSMSSRMILLLKHPHNWLSSHIYSPFLLFFWSSCYLYWSRSVFFFFNSMVFRNDKVLYSAGSLLRVFHWRFAESKSIQVSRTFLSILACHNKAVVWMASTYPRISKSSMLSTNSFIIVSSAPLTIDISITFMFHCFCFFQFSYKV